MNLNAAEHILRELRQPKYRFGQVKKAVFYGGADSYDDIRELPADVRERLGQMAPFWSFCKVQMFWSKKKDSARALFTMRDGSVVESVLMFHNNDRKTVCVSSQAGCAVRCSFCATGKIGFKRNLTAEEITDQVLYFSHMLRKDGKSTDNVVFMGMGEPFLNYENVMSAIRTLNDHEAFNIGQRHISVSTVGIVGGIKKFAKEKLQVNLAISLHAANNNTREKLIPLNKQYPVEDIMAVAREYVETTNRRLMLEYIMIDGMNDSPKDARALARLVTHKLFFVNLISCNDTGLFGSSKQDNIETFKAVLRKNGIDVIQRRKFGDDIFGACGQLAGAHG